VTAAAAGPSSAVDSSPRRRIRILYTTDNLQLGGTELNAVRTVERLDRSRFEIELLSFKPDGPLRARYEAMGVPITVFPLSAVVGVDAVGKGFQFAKFVRRGRFDIVHAHDLYTNIFAVPWARMRTPAAVIASRRWWMEVPRKAHRIANRLAYRFAHRVLANSPTIGGLISSAEGVSPHRVIVVPNFVDDDAFTPPSPEVAATLRRELRLESADAVIGVVANLHPVKEHVTLLSAAKRLTARWPKLRVVLIGDGACRQELESQARSLDITETVVFAGRRPNQPNFHFLFDVSTLTSRQEGFPNTIVEAMAAARPVVASAVGGIPDAVIDGTTGILVPPTNVDRLTAAFESLLADPARRRAMGEAAQIRARDQYYAPSVLGRLQDIYTELASGKR
jgi:glycosyltransferase involved in cell wall biosynthesis